LALGLIVVISTTFNRIYAVCISFTTFLITHCYRIHKKINVTKHIGPTNQATVEGLVLKVSRQYLEF